MDNTAPEVCKTACKRLGPTLALEAVLMELTLRIERQGATDTGDNVRGALHTIGENAGHIKQGLPKLRTQRPH
ncbi:hypothetical protein [Pseudomonas frederiksbergensis]|uniref:hypothetical protein n=1 Tax=Pseudomonas frederiksbergensis TaxID=104087 RepID=UPI003D1E3B18